MDTRAKIIAGVVIAILFFGGGALLRSQAREEAKETLIVELETSKVYQTHEALLRGVVEREHERTHARYHQRVGTRQASVSRFDTAGYRDTMLLHLVHALNEAGHERDAVALERFRVRER